MKHTIQIDPHDIYNYTARMYCLMYKIHDAKKNIMNINVFETLNTRGVSISGIDDIIQRPEQVLERVDVYGLRRYYELCSYITELYDDFYEELAASHIEQKRVIDFINEFLLNSCYVLEPGYKFEPSDFDKMFDDEMDNIASVAQKIGNTYPSPNHRIEEMFILISELEDEILKTGFDKHDIQFLNFNWFVNFIKDIESYNLIGLKGCNRRVESSFLTLLIKLKLLSEKYDSFRNNHKITSIIVDLISLFTSFGIVTGLVGLGQSFIKLIPNYETLDKDTIEEIVKWADMS